MKTLGSRWKIILVFLIIIGGLLFASYDLNQKNSTDSFKDLMYILTTALCTGLIVALVQYLLDLQRQKHIDNFASMGIKDLLDNRDNELLYGKAIASAHERLWIMGNTSSRLLIDFADSRKNKTAKRILIQALERGVKIRILVADKRHLTTPKDKTRFDTTKKRFIEIQEKFPENFKVKYYKHIPTHSIFVFDHECFIGPIFKELKSSETPSLHVKTGIDYSKKYLEHFQSEWEMAISL